MSDRKENGTDMPAAQTELKKQTERKANKKAERDTEPRIYLGPGFKGMTSGTVFKNGLPPVLNEMIAKCPVLGELVVPVRNLVKAKKELEKPDSAMSRFFQQAEIFVNNEKKGE